MAPANSVRRPLAQNTRVASLRSPSDLAGHWVRYSFRLPRIPCQRTVAPLGEARTALRLILLAAAILSGGTIASNPAYGDDESVSAQTREPQPKLPSLHLLRTLSLPNETSTFGMFQSGNSHLTLSRNGERLAAYVRNGLSIGIWSPDGKYQHEIPRYNSSGLGTSYVLKFFSGHAQLVTGPAAETDDQEGRSRAAEHSFSVLDANSGKVLRSIAGPNPGQGMPKNIAIDAAVSPDERFVALVYRTFADRRVQIYGTVDWQLVASIDLGDDNSPIEPQALTFSPDNKTLAVLHGPHGRVKLFDVASWKLLRSFDAFPEDVPKGNVVGADALAFSTDGTMIAVATHGGGSWWKYSNGAVAPQGSGTLTPYFPTEPLRVYRVIDGQRVGSLGSFPGGVGRTALAWSKGGYLGFIDGVGDIRFWDPFHPGGSIPVANMGHHSTSLLFSNDGSQLVANFEDGLKLFDIINAR